MGLGTVFVIGVTTARMIIPGLSDMPNIPGMKTGDFNAPARTLTMDLTSEKKVNAQSKAQCAIPEGLKLGPKVDLTVDLPVAVKDNGPIKDDGGKTEQKKFVMKMYWSCAETAPAGQPKVIDTDKLMNGKGMSPKDIEKFNRGVQKAVMDADKSHAYWPGPNAKKIQKDAATPGLFTLTTNYCGGTAVTFDKGQDFLAPIDLVSPSGELELAKTIKVEWKSIPNATAYLLTAFAANEEQMVMWTSSADPEMHSDILNKALSKTELEKLLQNGVLLQPAKTSCRIPAGIFKDVGNPMLMVTAFGTDKIQEKDGIITQVVVRSNATATLGMPGMTGEDEGEQATSDDDPGNVTEEAAKEETQEQPKETVKDTVRKVFGKLRKK